MFVNFLETIIMSGELTYQWHHTPQWSITVWKVKHFIFNPLHNSMNQQFFEKHQINRHENHGHLILWIGTSYINYHLKSEVL